MLLEYYAIRRRAREQSMLSYPAILTSNLSIRQRRENHHQRNQGGDKVNQTAVVRTTEKKNYKPLPLTPLISVSGRGGKHAANQGS